MKVRTSPQAPVSRHRGVVGDRDRLPRRWAPLLISAALALANITCSNRRETSPPEWLPDPLFGHESEAVLSHLASTCPKGMWWIAEHAIHCDLGYRNGYWPAVGVSFAPSDPEHRVTHIHLEAHAGTQELLDTFDEIVAPIVPAKIAGELRASILTRPAPVDRTESSPGFDLGYSIIEVARLREGAIRMTWQRIELPGSTPPRRESVQWWLPDKPTTPGRRARWGQ